MSGGAVDDAAGRGGGTLGILVTSVRVLSLVSTVSTLSPNRYISPRSFNDLVTRPNHEEWNIE